MIAFGRRTIHNATYSPPGRASDARRPHGRVCNALASRRPILLPESFAHHAPRLIAHDHILYRFFKLTTHLGDPALLLPLSLAVAGVLLWQNQRATGVWFGLVMVADVALTLVSKLWFYAGGGSTDLNILTPSGHVSIGVTFYGCLAIILASQRRFARQAAIAGAAGLAILGICVSRIALRMHTPEEVFFGSLVGALCVAGFAAGAMPLQRLRLRLPIPVLFAVAAASVSIWVIGHRFGTEELIGQWGVEIGSALGLS